MGTRPWNQSFAIVDFSGIENKDIEEVLPRTSMNDVLKFYDALAPNYRLMFENWDALIETEAEIIGPIIEEICGRLRGLRILDPTCGPGTHVLGLASRRHIVTGTDFSSSMIEQARQEANKRNLTLHLEQFDVKALASFSQSDFDAAICLGNSICAFTLTDELTHVFRQIRTKLREGAPFIVGLRDYSVAVVEAQTRKVTLDGPYHFPDGRAVRQRWEWSDTNTYKIKVYIERNDCCEKSLVYTCRAWLCKEVEVALLAAGFTNLHWLRGSTEDSVYKSGVDQLKIVAIAGRSLPSA